MRDKLLGIVRYNSDNTKDLAKAIGISYTSLTYKINGKSDFTREEIKKIKDRYKLSLEQVDEIFFRE